MATRSIDLGGRWLATPADDELRRSAIAPDHDPSGWAEVTVPSHWRDEPALADAPGPILYRTAFTLPEPADGERCFLAFDGIFSQADVWLDGAYLGDPEGYFVPHVFEITEHLRAADDHVLAVEVTSPTPGRRGPRRSITGVFGSEGAPNPGGLWQPVRIETTGPVRIDRWKVLCRDAGEAQAHLRLHARLDSDEARVATVSTRVDGILLDQREHSLAHGANEIDWNVDIANPRLWWPWSLGEQALTEVSVTVDVDGAVSDGRAARTGLREVAMQDWVLSVNGERLFLKGANAMPTRWSLSNATAAELRRDVEIARDAGLDMLRLRGHVTRAELYDAADELGVLLWQDLPLVGTHARSVRRQAVEHARAAVDLLGHHPSIVLWCGHDEPESGMIGQQLPSWNRTILDRWVKRALERADETRPVIAHSGVAPHLPALDGTATHLKLGAGHGDERDLPGLAATLPRLVRFVGAFGAAAPADPIDAEGIAAQRHQATLLRHHIETLRRLKYRPTGGFCLSSLADPIDGPGDSTAVLDHLRHAKPAFAAVVDACRPVVAVADRLPPHVTVGATIALDVHVVSDLHRPIEQMVCTATLSWPGGSHTWRWQGDVEEDSCVRVGTVQFVAPDAPGDLWLDLTLEHGEMVASNRYETTIVAKR